MLTHEIAHSNEISFLIRNQIKLLSLKLATLIPCNSNDLRFAALKNPVGLAQSYIPAACHLALRGVCTQKNNKRWNLPQSNKNAQNFQWELQQQLTERRGGEARGAKEIKLKPKAVSGLLPKNLMTRTLTTGDKRTPGHGDTGRPGHVATQDMSQGVKARRGESRNEQNL